VRGVAVDIADPDNGNRLEGNLVSTVEDQAGVRVGCGHGVERVVVGGRAGGGELVAAHWGATKLAGPAVRVADSVCVPTSHLEHTQLRRQQQVAPHRTPHVDRPVPADRLVKQH